MKIKSRDTNGNEEIVEIESLRRVDLKPSEKLVIQVDVGNIPPSRAKQFMDDIRQHFSVLFPSNTIIVIPSTMTLTILSVGP